MVRFSVCRLVGVSALLAAGLGYSQRPEDGANAADVFGEFVGSTPCGEPFGRVFDIPPDANPPVRWALTLYQDPKTRTPTVYKLRAEYDAVMPPATRRTVSKAKEGRWSAGQGTKFDPNAVVYELAGAVNFF